MEGEKKDMEGEKRDMEGKWGKENKHPAQTKIKKLTTAACNTCNWMPEEAPAAKSQALVRLGGNGGYFSGGSEPIPRCRLMWALHLSLR